jgi:hypothetical protein
MQQRIGLALQSLLLAFMALYHFAARLTASLIIRTA